MASTAVAKKNRRVEVTAKKAIHIERVAKANRLQDFFKINEYINKERVPISSFHEVLTFHIKLACELHAIGITFLVS